MFVPQPVNAHEFLKDRKDPPKAIDWWPTASYISCDGSLAVNTGGWTAARRQRRLFHDRVAAAERRRLEMDRRWRRRR